MRAVLYYILFTALSITDIFSQTLQKEIEQYCGNLNKKDVVYLSDHSAFNTSNRSNYITQIFGLKFLQKSDECINILQYKYGKYNVNIEYNQNNEVEYIKLFDIRFGGYTWDFVTLEFIKNGLFSRLFAVEFTITTSHSSLKKEILHEYFTTIKHELFSKYISDHYSWSIYQDVNSCLITIYDNSTTLEKSETLEKSNIYLRLTESLSKSGDVRNYLSLTYLDTQLNNIKIQLNKNDF